MAKQRLIHCDRCGEDFWWTLERRSDPMPEKCLVCENTGVPRIPKIKLSPRIRDMVKTGRAPGTISNYARSQDQVYRAMESSSADRAREAADMLGVPEAEMSHLKITDQKDNVRTGEVTAIIPPISKEMQAAMAQPGRGFGGNTAPVIAPSGGGGGFGGANGPSVAGPAAPQTMHIPTTGVGGAGASALGVLQASHQDRARAMTAAGEKGRHIAG